MACHQVKSLVLLDAATLLPLCMSFQEMKHGSSMSYLQLVEDTAGWLDDMSDELPALLNRFE